MSEICEPKRKSAVLSYTFSAEDAIHLHSILAGPEPTRFVTGANWLFEKKGDDFRVDTEDLAMIGLRGFFSALLHENRKTEAALLCWGNVLFDPTIREVKMIWEDLEKCNKLLVIGFGSAGKSYTIMAWTLLDWAEWPQGTSTKLISTTAGHAKANTFSTLSNFHKQSVIPLPGTVKDGFIGLGTTDKRSSISVVAIPPGDDGKGRLQGFHPVPVAQKHPKFGHKTRVRGILDEAEGIPSGLWQGVDNMLITMDSSGATKVAGAANPRLRESSFAQRVEPELGWESLDIETSDRWMGKQGFNVLRLDGKKSENVTRHNDPSYVERSDMMTYEGYMSFVKKGMSHPEYFTMARGWYPEGGAEFHITPREYFNGAVGIYEFVGMPTPVATLDPAFAEGGDNPIMTAGRYGQVSGFTPFGGNYVKFSKTFNGLQIEQQFVIKKGNTLVMAQEVVNYLKALQVRPEWFAMDRTGNATGLHDALKLQFGDILGVMWSEKATDKRILQEDTLTAEELYSGIVTEMAFAFSIWLQYGYIKIAPMMDATKLISQVTGRKYFFDGRGLMRTQSKADYKSDTGGQSPDEGDSAWMMPHLIRIRQSQNATMLPDHVRDQKKKMMISRFPSSPVNKMESYDIS